MKKSNKKRGTTVIRTIQDVENRRITRAERDRLKRLAKLPDEKIDTTDVPEVKGRAG
jgi:hypothetical protein